MLAPALFNLYFDIVIRMAIDKHCQEGRGVHIVYHPDAKLVGDHRKMTMETLVTDLEYVDDMALAHPSQPRCVCVQTLWNLWHLFSAWEAQSYRTVTLVQR